MNCTIILHGFDDNRVIYSTLCANSSKSEITIRLDCGHARTLSGYEYESFVEFPIIKCRLCDSVTDHRGRNASDFSRGVWVNSVPEPTGRGERE